MVALSPELPGQTMEAFMEARGLVAALDCEGNKQLVQPAEEAAAVSSSGGEQPSNKAKTHQHTRTESSTYFAVLST